MQGIDFVRRIHRYTTHKICIAAYANERGQGAPREALTRSPKEFARLVERYDQRGYGTYFTPASMEFMMVDGREHRRSKACAREVACVWSDLDRKDIDAGYDDILDAVRRLHCVPSFIIESGNGWHLYWLLKEAIDIAIDGGAVEALMRQIADVLAGDRAVAEVSRVMRIPGTHNTKGGAPFNDDQLVRVVHESDVEYELSDLADAFAEQEVLLKRKAAKAAQLELDEDNVWNKYVAEFVPTGGLDVKAAIAAMVHGNIHDTQLRVSASMLNHGHTVEEVVAALLAPSRAAYPGKVWNDGRELRKIEGMCMSFMRKLDAEDRARRASEQRPEPVQRPKRVETAPEPTEGGEASPQASEQGGAQVIPIRRRTAASGGGEAPGTKTKTDVISAVAKGTIAIWSGLMRRGLMRHNGDLHCYRDGLWRIETPQDKQDLSTLIYKGLAAMKESPKLGVVTAIERAVRSWPDLEATHDVVWDAPGHLVCANGVLDLTDGTFGPHSHEWYARHKVDIAYDAAALCPKWESVLARTFAGTSDANEVIGAVQEFFGYSLFPSAFDKRARRALILYGAADTGKTLITSMHRKLLGTARVGSPSTGDFSNRFGLQSLIDKIAWNRDEAVGEGDELNAAKFKALVSGDQLQVDRKGIPAWTGEMHLSVCLSMNALPWSREATRALAVRMIILQLGNVISTEEAHRVKDGFGYDRNRDIVDQLLADEGPGILNWCLEGLERLRDRGAYELPASLDAELQSFGEDTNPAREFAEQCLVEAPTGYVHKGDLAHAYRSWYVDHQGRAQREISVRAFMGMLRGAIPGLANYRRNERAPRAVSGWHLNSSGLKYWQRTQAELKYAVISGSGPNRHIGDAAAAEDVTEETLV